MACLKKLECFLGVVALATAPIIFSVSSIKEKNQIQKFENIGKLVRDECYLNFDSIKKIYSITDIDASVNSDLLALFIGDPNMPCAPWSYNKSSVQGRLGLWSHHGRHVPMVYYYSKKNIASDSGKSTVILRLVGGPGGNINPIVDSSIRYTGILNDGAILVNLAYYGTSHITFHPNPSFSQACIQSKEYIEYLQNKEEIGSVVIIGESLGGLIGTCAFSKLETRKKAKLFLVNPILQSPEMVKSKILLKMKKADKSDRKIIFRNIGMSDKFYFDGNAEKDYTSSVFELFFEKNEFKSTILQYLGKDSRRITLIYGENDDIIGVENIDKVMVKNLGAVHKITGMNHEIDDNYNAKISDIINISMNSKNTLN